MSEHAILAACRLSDSANAGVRERAAQERDLQHSRQSEIGDEFAEAAQKAVVFLTRERRADALTGSGQRRRRPGQRHLLNSASAPRRWPSFAAISTRTR